MSYYCGPISAGNLWVSLDKWEVAVVKTREYDTLLVKRNMSPTIFFFCRDQRRMHETVITSLYNPTHPGIFLKFVKTVKILDCFFLQSTFTMNKGLLFSLCLLPQKSVANSARHCKAQATGS